jgi:sarcosine oxidase subunit gamma
MTKLPTELTPLAPLPDRELHSSELVPLAPFIDLPLIPSAGRGVVVHDRDGMGIASVLVRRGQLDAFASQVKQCFGIELSPGPHRSCAGDIAFISTGPGAWFATGEGAANAFATSLTAAIGECAAISDQSDGQAVLRMSGPKIREALCKLVPVDLHARAFRIGDVAVTVAAHIGATLWRLEDDPHGNAVFEMAVYRSLADSLWTALSESAAEFGFKVNGR